MIASRVLPFSLLGFPLVFAACGGEGFTLPDEGAPANIEVLDPDLPRTGRVTEELLQPLVVRVTDSRDDAVEGATVVFSFPDGAPAGEALPNTVTTNADGLASTLLKLGTVAGTYNGIAEVPVDQGVTPVRDTFTVTALPADANGIRLVSGDNQTSTVNSALPLALVVEVTDASGNRIPNVPIQWTAEGGGSVSAASTVTDANGQASVTRVLGGTAGVQTTVADAGLLAGSPVTFTSTATAGNAAGITKVQGDNQSGSPGAQLALPLIVEVRDELGNPIPDRPVSWVVGAGGGSVSAETTPTNAEGRATINWTLGPAVGANSVNAVVSGVGTATFNATATAGSPSAENSEVSAAPSTISVNSQATITVVVRDASNIPVSGASVIVASSGTGNTITPNPATTGSNGVATFTFRSTVGEETKTITATAGGVAIDDQAMITVQRTGSDTEIRSTDPEPSTVGQSVRVAFTVDGLGGTPAGQVTVTADSPGETCSGTVADGFCNITFTAPGNRRLTARYAGDSRFAPSSDGQNHQVNAAPEPNQAPRAAFEPPACVVGVPCQFIDGSTDPDGSISSRSWTFPDAAPPSSIEQNPTVIFLTEGSKSVTLTVTDDEGASDTVMLPVAVSAPQNQAPTAGNDAYTTPGTGQALAVVAPGVLSNDADPDGPQPLVARNASDPALGSVSLNADGSFTYTPDLGATGNDSFTYEAFDGDIATPATVTITIAP